MFHTADWHLGLSRIKTINRVTKLETTLSDTLKSIDTIIDKAISIDQDGNSYCDVFIVAGDIFHESDPQSTIYSLFAMRLRRLLAKKIQVVFVLGNHDNPISDIKKDPLDQYSQLELLNLHVLSKPDLIKISTNRGSIQILAIPWMSVRRHFSIQKGKLLSEKEIHISLVEKFRQKFDLLVDKAEENTPLIFVSHLGILGAEEGIEQTLTFSSEPFLDPTYISHEKIKYGALGHFHKHQEVNKNPPIVYSGSIQRFDFSEENEKKGYVEIQFHLDQGEVDWQFKPLPTRIFKTLRITIPKDLLEYAEINKFIANEISSTKLENNIVRIYIGGEKEAIELLDEKEIKGLLKNAYYVHSIKFLVPEDFSRLRVPSLSKDSTISKAIELYLSSTSLDPKRREELYAFALRFLSEQGYQETIT